jgi:predicted butyrate kinase (DUF1464 family)
MTCRIVSRMSDREGIEILQVAIPSGFSYLHLLYNASSFLPDHCIIIVKHTGGIDRTVHIQGVRKILYLFKKFNQCNLHLSPHTHWAPRKKIKKKVFNLFRTPCT